jgi:hypothetical protein
VKHRTLFLADQRGAVALEMPAVVLFMMIWLLVPLADLAIAGFQFVSAWGALRNFGQYTQYHSPQAVASKLPTTVAGYPISNLQVLCGNAACSPSNSVPPKYYSYTTTVTSSPMVLRPVLCGSANPSCLFTLHYSERFQ